MTAKFEINILGAQDKATPYNEILTDAILKDITYKITKSTEYTVDWQENSRTEGRLIILQTDSCKYYINLSQTGPIQSRNNYFQSVSTAFAIYLKNKIEKKEKSKFYFYFLPFSGNNKTNYMLFMYSVMKTIGIEFLNPDYGLNQLDINTFNDVKNIINERNLLRDKNSGNRSSYLTDEGYYYHFYGKTFGANSKETALLCLAMISISDKPIKLFQIIDNNSTALSSTDIEAMDNFAKLNNLNRIKIFNDFAIKSERNTSGEKENIRSARFIYNLLEKYNGKKHCLLCNCKIESIIQAAHIYPVAAIKERDDLSKENKFQMAADKDNGLWLCDNHHKLFDRNIIYFYERNLQISNLQNEENRNFIKRITPEKEIPSEFCNKRMLSFFDLRDGKTPREEINYPQTN